MNGEVLQVYLLVQNRLFIKVASCKLALACCLNYVSIFTFQYNLICTQKCTHTPVQLMLEFIKILMVFILSVLISINFWQLTAFKVHAIVSPAVTKKELRLWVQGCTERKITEQATKNTEYQMEIETFLFCFSHVFLSLYFFFTRVPSCYFILNMFLAAGCFLTGTDVVLGL